jgi:hypothetical protein
VAVLAEVGRFRMRAADAQQLVHGNGLLVGLIGIYYVSCYTDGAIWGLVVERARNKENGISAETTALVFVWGDQEVRS